MIDAVKPKYKYEEIKASFLRDIRGGVLCPGDKLPVRTQLVETFNATRTTVDKALNDLISENILSASRRNGTFVIATPQSLKKIAIVSWKDGVMQHAHMFGEPHNYFSMYGRLLDLLENRPVNVIDNLEALKDPELLDKYDVVLFKAQTKKEVLRLATGIAEEKIMLLNAYLNGYASISIDHYAAAKEVTELFLTNVPDADIYLIDCESDLVVDERRRGFIDACENHRSFYRLVEFDKEDPGNFHIENMEQIKIPKERPLIVISSTGEVTGTVMRYIAENGLKHNKNFYYADFDNINPLKSVGYPIMSVLENFTKIAEMVVKKIDGALEPDREQTFIPYEIINNPFEMDI